jgi:hypothetical protein
MAWTDMKGLARLPDALRTKGSSAQQGFDVAIEPASGATQASLTGVLDLVICDIETHKVCVPVRRTVRAEFAVEGATEPGVASLELPAAR